MSFEDLAMQVYEFQKVYNKVYADYISNLGSRVVSTFEDIPHLPISAFKHHKVKCGIWEEEIVYSSSGTSNTGHSLHYVKDRQAYLDQTVRIFEQQYGAVSEYVFLALLPNYLERGGSSLVDMMKYFIDKSDEDESDFYLYDHDKLIDVLNKCKSAHKKCVLFGVSYALMDFCENHKLDFPDLIVMETGGMKGQRKELPKASLHQIIKNAFGVKQIHSEYGMTELSSQLYSSREGIFSLNKYMKTHIREISDPFTWVNNRKQGIVCITDLANIDSCSFIMTEDTGYMPTVNSLVLTGRLDISEARGCNLMLEEF